MQQDQIPAAGAAETLRVAAIPGDGAFPTIRLSTGESLASWLESEARVANPEAGPGPVGDAPAGDVIARFEGGRWFAWREDPFVWTAPRTGALDFALNLRSQHGVAEAARVSVARLGPPGSEARSRFPPPSISLNRVPGGLRVRYADRAGFGLDLKSLRLTVTTSRDAVHSMAAWGAVEPAATFLPLPPPDIPLPPGIHTLTATIEDWLGNGAPPATVLFDAVR